MIVCKLHKVRNRIMCNAKFRLAERGVQRHFCEHGPMHTSAEGNKLAM